MKTNCCLSLRLQVYLILILFSVSFYSGYSQTWVQKGNSVYGDLPGSALAGVSDLSDDGNNFIVTFSSSPTISGVRVYAWNGTGWVQKGSTLLGTFNDFFGNSVSINGNGTVIAIGIPQLCQVKIYNWSGSNWVLATTIDRSLPFCNGPDDFGWSLDLNNAGDILVVRFADPFESFIGITAVYRYDFFNWNQMGTDIYGEASNDFVGETNGVSISGDGSYVASGAAANDGNGSSSGHTRTHSFDGFSWNQFGADIDGGSIGEESGYAVAMNYSGMTMAVGAHFYSSYTGQVKVYSFSWPNWTLKGSPLPGYSFTGQSLGISDNGNTVIVGGEYTVEAYRWNSTNWVQLGQQFTFPPADGGHLDVDISSDGNSIFIGENTNDENGVDAGCARVYTLCYPTTSLVFPVACNSYTVPSGDETYTISGSYKDTLVNAHGCDSVITINLTVNHANSGTDVISACDSYTWIDGITYTSDNNTATHTLTNINGCDSLVTLNLTISHSNTGTDVQTACDSYTWIDGITYTSSNNTATYTLTNINGCDSLVTLNLTISHSNTGTDVQTACDSYTWIDGITYTSDNNTATHTLTNINGCDSLVTLNLTINHSNTGTDVQTACDSYTWIDGITYTSDNNTATHTLTNINGCDSLVTLNLTINHSNIGTDVQSACDSYTWINGITYTSDNNTATHTLTNVNGCDSLVTLNLTINHSNTGTDVQTACDSYTWIDGITYTSDNNTATHTLTNVNGCDSLVTLNLTINHSNTGTDVQTACEAYTWIDGITYTTSNNTATHTLINVNGCDSLVTLNLTINHSNTGTDVQTACEAYTWIDGITYTTSNNTATHTLTNVNGCDSLVTLNLTIINVNNEVSSLGPEITAAAEDASYQWLDCNDGFSVLAGEISQIFIATENGDYAVEITQYGCVDTSDCVMVYGIGVAENNFSGMMVLYPNPTDGKITIDAGENYPEIRLNIFDETGKMIKSVEYKNTRIIVIQIEGMPGNYLIEINTVSEKKAVFKVMKK